MSPSLEDPYDEEFILALMNAMTSPIDPTQLDGSCFRPTPEDPR